MSMIDVIGNCPKPCFASMHNTKLLIKLLGMSCFALYNHSMQEPKPQLEMAGGLHCSRPEGRDDRGALHQPCGVPTWCATLLALWPGQVFHSRDHRRSEWVLEGDKAADNPIPSSMWWDGIVACLEATQAPSGINITLQSRNYNMYRTYIAQANPNSMYISFFKCVLYFFK